ncbi:MAG: glycosyl transferase family 2, partial [Lachnospiraceae bacterium]|nr:glycosyl transferase family 2 [Lachnospiraceae bacterium]
PTKVSFVKAMTDELFTFFPDFRENEYYKARTGEEEKRLIDMACDSAIKFYVYYKLLWAYRNMMKKIRGR